MTSYLNPSTRFNGADQIVVGDRVPLAEVLDAPFDDEQYVRFNGDWVPYAPPAPDLMPPAPPMNLDATGSVVPGENAVDYTLTWDAPTTNADATPLTDFAYYVVRWRYVGAPSWTSFVSNDDSFLLSRATLGEDLEWGVLARDYNGNDSTWATDTVSGAVDVIGPEKPSDPIVSSSSGTITAVWDGEDHLGDPPPADFARLEFYTSTSSSGPWTLRGSITAPGSLLISGETVGSTRWVSTVSVDVSGNDSVRSDAVSVVVAGVVGGDLEPGSVQPIHLSPDVFSSALMRTKEYVGDGSSASTTSTTGATMGTTGAEGVFEAPASGIVEVTVQAELTNTSISSAAACSFEVREGATIGSGTVVDAASSDKAAYSATVEAHRTESTYLVDGLTPGDDYNIRTLLFSSVGTNTAGASRVRLLVRPSF